MSLKYVEGSRQVLVKEWFVIPKQLFFFKYCYLRAQQNPFFLYIQTGIKGEEVFRSLSEHGLDSPQASKCGELLTLMLTRCWPKPKAGVPCSTKEIFKHVLNWRLWPCFFQRFGNHLFRLLLQRTVQVFLVSALLSSTLFVELIFFL